ncbi:MAG: nicotinate-nucleotide--dimethylbenzimidazole phosphoribosyltransferase [Candidatus Schekmanbacteria bacterium]|nr:nicotinate-nucleotide--dimethylbenzimidazole phosphoribosyltransferase [Candidatus Schekmanbacteria bacterium]
MGLLEQTVKQIVPVDKKNDSLIQKRLDNLTKPQGSLGRLEELAKQYVLITGKNQPSVKNKTVVVMAGDHGVTAAGVSAFPQEVTPQMVLNFLRGGAGINVLSRHAGAKVIVVDIGVASDIQAEGLISRKVAYGTADMSKQAAMTRDEAIKAIEVGIDVVLKESSQGLDLLATGEMGIGNTTPSSAITAVITGRPVSEVTGRGTGITEEARSHKVEVIEQAIKLNRPDAQDALDVLSKVGGLEIAGLAGVILAGAALRIPVVIDGFISGAAALIAAQLQPAVKDYLIAAHRSVEKGHTAILNHLGLSPLLDLNLRLGEGTGAVLAMSLVEAGVKVLTEMASFDEAAVSRSME